MSPTTFVTGGTGLHGQPAAARSPHSPGHYDGTTWRSLDVSAKQVRWLLQTLLLAAAFLLLMSFYTVVRGAVARGPAVLAAAPAGTSATLSDPACDPALHSTCAQEPVNAVLAPRAAPRRVSSFEPR